jgi:hypothetical protein
MANNPCAHGLERYCKDCDIIDLRYKLALSTNLLYRITTWYDRLEAYWKLHPMSAIGERKGIIEERDSIVEDTKKFLKTL